MQNAATFGIAASLGGCASIIGKTAQYGVQLWTVRSELQNDFYGTLNRLNAIRFSYVETAGLGPRSAKEFRQAANAAGLDIRACHYGMEALIQNLEMAIGETIELGGEYLVCSSPAPIEKLDANLEWPLAMEKAMNIESLLRAGDFLAKTAPKIKSAGLKFAYHNHHFELKNIIYRGENRPAIDLLIAQTNGDDLKLELDLGWALVAGANPIAILEKYKDRTDLLHLKDMKRDFSSKLGFESTEIGNGQIDWQEMKRQIRNSNVKYQFIEQEGPYKKPVFESLSQSLSVLMST